MVSKAVVLLDDKENNQVVTNMYLDTILKAMGKLGFDCRKKISINEINKQTDYIIVDECKVAFKYYLKGYKNIVVWIQGIVPEEALLKGYSKYRYYAYSFIERIVLKKAKFVFMVSDSMLRHYVQKYQLNISYKTYIMPCFNENRIDKNSFNNPEKYVNNSFLYAGSLQEWQCFNETIEVYKKIEEKISNTELVVFTQDKVKAREIINSYHIKNYSVNYAPANELGEKIRNIKFGFVLRKDVEVNGVATPTKISNYISHGIIPIYSPCLKSFDDYNKKNNSIALQIDLNRMDEGVNRIVDFINEKAISNKEMRDWSLQVFNSYYNQQKYIFSSAKKMEAILNVRN